MVGESLLPRVCFRRKLCWRKDLLLIIKSKATKVLTGLWFNYTVLHYQRKPPFPDLQALIIEKRFTGQSEVKDFYCFPVFPYVYERVWRCPCIVCFLILLILNVTRVPLLFVFSWIFTHMPCLVLGPYSWSMFSKSWTLETILSLVCSRTHQFSL